MKWLGAVLCMICMMFGLCTDIDTAYAWNSAEIVAVAETAEKGGTAKVTLKISDNPGIWGLNFQVGYDHDVMKLTNVNVGDVFTQGEIVSPESYDKETYVFYATRSQFSNTTTNGTLVVLEFQISDTAKAGDYAVSLEFTECINIDGKDVKVNMSDGKVTVVDCFHGQTEWKVTENPKCEQKGKETESCKKCGQVLGTRDIKETGHQNTAVRNASTATETKEGYTGDKYCTDCDKLLEKGTVIPKVEKPQEPEKPEPQPDESESESNSEPQPSESESESNSEPQPDESESESESNSEVQTEEESESQADTNAGKDKEPSSPFGGVVVGIVIVGLVGLLAAMYIKFIKKGR